MLTQTKKVTSPLVSKATLLTVNMSQWTARKLDREVTDEVNTSHHASADAGRYNKLLVEKHRLEELTQIRSEVRAVIEANTKPWLTKGPRILPNMLYQATCDKLRELSRKHDAAADLFAAEFGAAMEERKSKLNGLFKESDYPSVSEIRSKFSLTFKICPIAEADGFSDDFRTQLDQDTLDDIKAELEDTNAKLLDNVFKDSIDKVLAVVRNMSVRLGEYGVKEKSKLYDSVVGNVRELADLLPAFNLTDDPKFDKLIERIKSELCVEETETLKEDASVRASVKKSADQIVADVEKFFG
jgi:hypothetical protein